MLLLEGIDTYGLGNWGAVAEHVGSSKTPEQCKVGGHGLLKCWAAGLSVRWANCLCKVAPGWAASTKSG